MEFEAECFFVCPHCAQRISMVVDELSGSQSYIEDCEVCCNPIQISYDVEDGRIVSIHAEKA